MKKIILVLLVLMAGSVLLISSCKKTVTEVPEPAVKDSDESAMRTSETTAMGELTAFYRKYGPRPEVFGVNPDQGIDITLRSGTIIRIPANAFMLNGEILHGDKKVRIAIWEMVNRGQMALRGVNTLSSTTVLESNGSFQIVPSVEGIPVDPDLVPGTRIEFSQPDRLRNATPLNLFAGGPSASTGLFDWIPQSPPDQATNLFPFKDRFDFWWWWWNFVNPDKPIWLKTVEEANTFSGRAPATFTTVQAKLSNNPGEPAGYLGQTGNTVVLFVPVQTNTLVQLSSVGNSSDYFTTPGSIVPTGIKGRLLAYSVKDGTYYYTHLDIVTEDPVDPYKLELKEVAVEELVAALAKLREL